LIQRFYINISHVVEHDGGAPRDIIVLSNQNRWDTSERDAGYTQISALRLGVERNEIPERRIGKTKVWVVRQHRLACGGRGAIDDPVIGAKSVLLTENIRRSESVLCFADKARRR